MRADGQEVVEAAHLIDGDLLARLFLAVLDLAFVSQGIRLQQAKVGMVALTVPVAGEAFATSLAVVLRLFAEQAGGKKAGQLELADAFLTDQQQRMRQLPAPGLQTVPGLFVKLNNVHKQFVVTICSSVLRISSRLWLASTMRMRDGLACARSM